MIDNKIISFSEKADFVNFLIDNKAKEAFELELESTQGLTLQSYLNFPRDIELQVFAAFDWETSKQGEIYWNIIHDAWRSNLKE